MIPCIKYDIITIYDFCLHDDVWWGLEFWDCQDTSVQHLVGDVPQYWPWGVPYPWQRMI